MYLWLLRLLVSLISEPYCGSTLFTVIVHEVKSITDDTEIIALHVLIL